MSHNEARYALSVLKSDLTEALHIAATLVDADAGHNLAAHGWTVSAAKPDIVDLSFSDISQCRFGRGGVWLRMIGRSVDPGEQVSAPSAIAYQIVRRPYSSGDVPRYGLYRSVVEPKATLAAGYGIGVPMAAAYATPNSSAPGLAGNITSPHGDQLIAGDVIDFGVRVYDTVGAPIFPDADPVYSHAARIARVEIFLRILTPQGALLISGIESGKPGDWWNVALANSDTYSASVPILVAPIGATIE